MSASPLPAAASFPLQWSMEPSVLLGLALLAAVYALAAGPLRRQHGWGPPIPRIRQAAFILGVLVAFLALCSPLDTLSDEYLFSAHMIQHMLLTYVAPPLWLLGLPAWMVAPLWKSRPAGAWLRRLASPLPAFLIFNGMMWAWHAPTAYDAALRSEGLHVLEHLCFIASALLGWAPVLLGRPAGGLSTPARGLYLFANTFPCTALAALLTFSAPLYAFYASAPRLWGLALETDQQLGGLLMWIPADMILMAAALLYFARALSLHSPAEQA